MLGSRSRKDVMSRVEISNRTPVYKEVGVFVRRDREDSSAFSHVLKEIGGNENYDYETDKDLGRELAELAVNSGLLNDPAVMENGIGAVGLLRVGKVLDGKIIVSVMGAFDRYGLKRRPLVGGFYDELERLSVGMNAATNRNGNAA